MKKFIFGIIAIVMAVAVWISLGEKEAAAHEPVPQNSVEKIATASLERVAEMVWALGLTDSIDEENPEELQRWRDRCENAMLLYYDSVNPGNQMAKEKKADSVLDEIEANIPEEDTTAGMILHSLKLYSTLMLRVELYTRRILQSDSSFSEEIKAWNELYSSLSNFCIGVTHSEWYGGSGAGPMMGAARNGVLEVRAKDLHRIIQLGGGSDPASDEMVDYKMTALLEAVNRKASSVSMPAEVKDYYNKEQLQRYRELYDDIMNNKKKLPDAITKWLKSRDKYKGSSAAALDDMTDVVGFSPTAPEEESEEVKIDKNSPYSYDENQTEVIFSEQKDTLIRFPRVMMGGDYVIPSTVKYIDERAFEGCKNIESVVIPPSVNEIGMAAFDNCPKLERVYILTKIDKIPFRCFNGCVSLSEIHLASVNPPTIEHIENSEEESLISFFNFVNRQTSKVYVPKGSRQKYRKAYGWKTFKNIVEE